nr:hypothetical protein [Limosilactobacillus equigenerosi]
MAYKPKQKNPLSKSDPSRGLVNAHCHLGSLILGALSALGLQ